MSPQSSDSKRPAQSPGIYDGLMFVAVSALITGCIFLALELSKYGWTAAP